ncbi:ABC transporter substrate-binding protein [Bacillus sp. TS-2]|nr:ABC transporter substrate-binding protein [Bacillus sp. TS-2]
MIRNQDQILFIFLFIFILVGCQSEEALEVNETIEEEYVSFTLFSADFHSQWDYMESPVSQVVQEKTGVKIEAEFDVNGGEQKIALMAANGEYPDLILPKGSASTLVDTEALIDLAPLIDQYAPNIKELYGDYLDRLRWSSEDPSIYILSTVSMDHTYWAPDNGFLLQHDVVKELGYPKIRTVKDFEEAIRSYKKRYPTIDGEPTIGLSLLADDWRILISTTNPAFYATGASDDGEYYVDPDTYKATLHYRRPEEKEYFRWLNHMNDSGLLDPESFVQKYEQYLEKISSGRVLGLIDSEWSVSDAQRMLREKGKEKRMYGMYPVTLSEEYKHPNFQDTGYLGGWGVGITVDCEDPILAIQFLDFLASEEGQILQNWGIENKHYQIIDGKRVISEEEMFQRNHDSNYVKKTGIGVLDSIAPSYGDGVKDSSGQTYTIASPDQIIDSYSSIEKEVLSSFGVSMWKDLYPPKEAFPVKPWGSAFNLSIDPNSQLAVINQKALEIVKERIPEVILVEPSEFDSVWETFMNELLDIGIEKAEEEYSRLIKERMKLWEQS